MADGTRTLLVGDGPLADGLHDGLVHRGHVVAQVGPVGADRPEERPVGEECRFRGAAYP